MNWTTFSPLKLHHFYVLATSLCLLSSGSTFAAEPNRERQQQYLEDSLSINRSGKGRYPRTTRQDATWEEWQKRTGELPPDFEQMRSMPFLPDPLELRAEDGTTRAVQSKEDWEQKRQYVKEQFTHYISGSFPPPPGNVEAEIISDTTDGGVHVQMIELRFGPDHKAKMTLELLIPPGDTPRPVYMTQWNHRDWAQLAVRRGYIGAIYAAADIKDDSEEYQDLYPDYEFSQLMRRAWGASRVVDYLLTRPEVHKNQIAITGHSRNGKQSLWATAFDDRIGAVISSSCGTGGITPWRYCDPQYANESLDTITGIANAWFHPRLRYFFGREDKLPIDQNELLALIAPRPQLFHYSVMERNLNPWSVEQNFHSVKSVYDYLGAPRNLGIFGRNGEHAVAARDVERCIDFLDSRFGRHNVPWQDTLLFDWDFDEWRAEHKDATASATEVTAVTLRDDYGTSEAFQSDRAEILNRLEWLLGDEPAGVEPHTVSETASSRQDWRDLITGRPEVRGAKAVHIGPYTAMGDHLAGTLYVPVDKEGTTRTLEGGEMPVVIYLHQYSYAHGFAHGYRSDRGGIRDTFESLTKQGIAVMAIDMFGFGNRLLEAKHFYKRQPHWSTMGKMVDDVTAVVDALDRFDFVDKDRIFVMGESIGGTVALLAAAQDERIDGVAVVAAFSPWRTSNERYESIRVISHQHGFMPRLGLYANNPQDAPVDFPEIMATIAPRPLLVISPVLDWHTDSEAVTEVLDKVAKVYNLHNASNNLQTDRPREINRTTRDMNKRITEFFLGVD